MKWLVATTGIPWAAAALPLRARQKVCLRVHEVGTDLVQQPRCFARRSPGAYTPGTWDATACVPRPPDCTVTSPWMVNDAEVVDGQITCTWWLLAARPTASRCAKCDAPLMSGG